MSHHKSFLNEHDVLEFAMKRENLLCSLCRSRESFA